MSALIEALRDPRCYPHPVQDVRVIETHISWVLLTGAYAYKIKKPVRLEFVDFCGIERRRHFCLEELRLNRRLAPQIYLDVVAITGTPQQPHIGGDGNAIEYAVKMREFAQADLLDRCLVENRLQPEHIDALADVCERFHAAAAVAPERSAFGAPGALLRPALANFETIAALLADDGLAQRIHELERWTARSHAQLLPSFAARKAHGRIRECHGDMHLGNIALLDGQPTAFDCIEFNDEFRWIDVMSDLAFTVMDLAARGRPQFARRLLNRYLEAGGDYDGVRVLRYYLAYRALVRAKVDCIRARQAGPGSDVQAREWRDFSARIELAEAYVRPCRPFLAITCGLSGSGKTHTSQVVVEHTGAIRIRSDVERKRLAGVEQRARSAVPIDGDIYAEVMSDRTFARLAELARIIVEAGYAAIVDATFIRHHRREPFRQLAASLAVPLVIVHCQAPEEVLAQRITQRLAAGADASEADLRVLEVQRQHEQPLDASERAVTIDIDSTDASSIAAMTQRLQQLTRAR